MSEEPKIQADQKPQGSRKWTGPLLVLILACGAIWWWRDKLPQAWLPAFMRPAATAGAGKGGPPGDSKGGKRGGAASRPVPVVIAQAARGDLPIYLNGLGTVTSLRTVTLRTRVDGELQKIHFTEGQIVKQDDLIAEIDPRPFQVQLTQAQGQLAKDTAALQNAKLDLKRYEEARAAVTQQQVDTAAANVAQFEGAVKTDQGQIDSAQLNLTYCHIVSPIPGRIGLRLVDQGNVVHAADANGLVVITQIEPITVVFSLPEVNLPRILKPGGGNISLPVEAYDREMTGVLARGTLQAIDSQIDPTTGTIRCKALFENKDQKLFPNQFVNVRLLVDTKKAATLIPLAAVQRSPQTTFVYVVKADQSVGMRPVTLGPEEAEKVVVEKGLEPGETVVTEGVDKLQPGMKVTTPEAKGGEGHGHKPQEGGPPGPHDKNDSKGTAP